jgi:mycofactocin system glycosyltransferase
MQTGYYRQPASDCYRLAAGIRVSIREADGLAICPYPLRVVRLSRLAASLLQRCRVECTCEQLASSLKLPAQRVQVLCEQLRWKGMLEAGPSSPPAEWPGVSIIIPSHNRAQQLERCLRALSALDYPAGCLEKLVVDDASTDETDAMLRRLQREYTSAGRRLRVVRHTTRRGAAESRNTGARAAQYDLLAFIDSDCVASHGWLNELVPAFQQGGIAAVGGMIRSLERTSMLGRYEDVRSSLFMGVRPQQVDIAGPLTYLPTANLLLRKEAWQRLGGFAPLTFGEDVDFCRRLLATSARIVYVPRGVVYHDYRSRLRPFLGIRAAYASSEALLLRLHPTSRRVLRLPPEQASFAGLFLGGLGGTLAAPWATGTGPLGGRRSVKFGLCALVFALILACSGSYRRWHKVRKQDISIGPLTIFRATLRGHLAYTYHLCRHLTRYYTLPLLLAGIIMPPLLLAALLLISLVVGVDYIRLRPAMGPGAFALCSVLDDCAYEVGVVRGCLKHGTLKPLWPLIRI